MKSPWLAVCIVAAVALLPATESQSADSEKKATPTPDPMLGKELGDVRDDNGLETKLVWCPPGFVTMDPDCAFANGAHPAFWASICTRPHAGSAVN